MYTVTGTAVDRTLPKYYRFTSLVRHGNHFDPSEYQVPSLSQKSVNYKQL